MIQFLFAIVALLICIVSYFTWGKRGHRQIKRGLQSISALEATMAAYRSGDYNEVLKQAPRLKKGLEDTAAFHFFRGKALYQLGQFEEAEANLRKGFALETDVRRAALVHQALGSTVLEQGRYADAVSYYEKCVEAWPDRGCGHRAIAEALLRKGDDKAEALLHARRAVEIDGTAEALTPEIHNSNLAEAQATLAWAIAENSAGNPGVAEEVEQLLSRAFPMGLSDSTATLAELHYHAGRAYLALGLTEKAAEHLRKAEAADPQGNIARLARSAASAQTAN